MDGKLHVSIDTWGSFTHRDLDNVPEVDNNVDIESNWDKEVESFDDLKLNMDLLRGIYAYGFEKPSVIQQKAILPVLEGHDTIAQAQSGKTN